MNNEKELIEIKDKETKEFVISFLKKIREKQLETKNKVVYCPIKLFDIVKNKLFLIDFVTHYKILKEKNFYDDDAVFFEEEELYDKIKEIIEFESTVPIKESVLSTNQLNDLIKYFREFEKSHKSITQESTSRTIKSTCSRI